LGEQQRLGIARSLVCDPKIILADEPTSSLDDKNCREVVSLLEEQKKMTQTALIIVTHDQRLKAQFGSQIQL
jgi:putative ABC transport system ATP-binding protein